MEGYCYGIITISKKNLLMETIITLQRLLHLYFYFDGETRINFLVKKIKIYF